MDSRKFDVVLMGATSFVGQITARELALHAKQHQPGLRWAMAGRSLSKLQAVKQDIERRMGASLEVELITAESLDDHSMSALSKAARVVISTVGPYDLYGEKLVKQCALNGTHYCDLTGEANFCADMIARYNSVAVKSGACIVHCCGFDSIPSDIGVYYLQQQSKSKFGHPCVRVDMRVARIKGSFSGGTYASIVNMVKKTRRDPELRKQLLNPYLLATESEQVRQPYVAKATEDSVTGKWVAPFVMAAINTKVVLRSAEQLAYPHRFLYNEAVLTGAGKAGKKRAKIMALGLNATMVGAALAPTRWVMEKFLLPKPGEGPSEQEQVDGHYEIHHHGETTDGNKITVKFSGDRDPGYGSTARMLTQAAMALAFDLAEEQRGGFYTPASLLGDSLLQRLPAHAGITICTL